MISIKVLISIEIARFIPKCTRCFVDLAFTFFPCMLNTLIFTVDSYIFFKKYQCIPRPDTIVMVYSLVKHDCIISYCKMLITWLEFLNSQIKMSNECLLKSSATTHAQLLAFLH